MRVCGDQKTKRALRTILPTSIICTSDRTEEEGNVGKGSEILKNIRFLLLDDMDTACRCAYLDIGSSVSSLAVTPCKFFCHLIACCSIYRY